MDNLQPPMVRPVPTTTPDVKPVQRPRSVSILLLGVLIITVLNLTRFVLSLRDWGFLASQYTISPLYLAISGLVWTVAGFFLIWGLWRAKNWAPRLMQAIALTYALYYWLDLLFLRDHPVRGVGIITRIVLPTNWQFSIGVTIVCLAYIAWTLGRSKVKGYFGLAGSENLLNQPDENHGNEI